jgi:hypothetical protein
MKLKNFIEFINEYDDNGPLSINIAGQKTPLNNDLTLDKEVEEYMDKKDEECARCGKAFEECRCEHDDFWSTHTYHRTPAGDKVEIKSSQKFKKE